MTMPKFDIVVKGYIPQCAELTFTISAKTEEAALATALKRARTGAFDHEAEGNDADSDYVWEDAELAEDDE